MTNLIKKQTNINSWIDFATFGHEIDTITQSCAGDPVKAVIAHLCIGTGCAIIALSIGGPLVGLSTIAILTGTGGLIANSALVSVRYKQELESGQLPAAAPTVALPSTAPAAPPRGQNCGNCQYGITGICAQDGLAVNAAETCGQWLTKPVALPTYAQAIAPLPEIALAQTLIQTPPTVTQQPQVSPTMSVQDWHIKFQAVMQAEPAAVLFTWAQIMEATALSEDKAIALMGSLEEKYPVWYTVDISKKTFTALGVN